MKPHSERSPYGWTEIRLSGQGDAGLLIENMVMSAGGGIAGRGQRITLYAPDGVTALMLGYVMAPHMFDVPWPEGSPA